MDTMNKRFGAAGEYLSSIVSTELDQYEKGVWIGMVRAATRKLGAGV